MALAVPVSHLNHPVNLHDQHYLQHSQPYLMPTPDLSFLPRNWRSLQASLESQRGGSETGLVGLVGLADLNGNVHLREISGESLNAILVRILWI